MPSLDDPNECEMCHAEYILFIKFPTPSGSKDICGGCRKEVLEEN